MLKETSIWGACAGLFYCILTYLSFAHRQLFYDFPAWGLVSKALYFMILGLFILLAMRRVRSKYYGTLGINYAQTLYTGVITSVVTGIIAATFAFCYIYFIEPQLKEHLTAEMTALMTKMKSPAKDIQDMKDYFSSSYTPSGQFMSTLIGTTVMGIICSALLAVFVRNRDTFTSTN